MASPLLVLNGPMAFAAALQSTVHEQRMSSATLRMSSATLRPSSAAAPEQPPLIVASRNGDSATIHRLLESGAYPVNMTDTTGMTSLHWACANGHLDVVRLLLLNGGNIFARTVSNHLTPLHFACRAGHQKVIQLLMEWGADPAALSLNNNTPFDDLPETLKGLKKKYAKAAEPPKIRKNADKIMESEASLLHFLDRHLDEVDEPIEETHWLTPLMFAARAGQAEIVHILLMHCARAHPRDKTGKTALHWACISGTPETVMLLIEYNSLVNMCDSAPGMSPLHYAVLRNDVRTVRVLLPFAYANMPDKEGKTPLLLCARSDNNTAVAEALLTMREIDVNLADAHGLRPLHEAAARGDHLLVSMLLQSIKTNVNVADNYGNLPLHSACAGMHPEVVQMILERGRDPSIDAKNAEGCTPLLILMRTFAMLQDPSMSNRIIATLRHLLAHYAKPNFSDNDGRSALMFINVDRATREGSTDHEIAVTLVEAGADPAILVKEQFLSKLKVAERDSVHYLVSMLNWHRPAPVERGMTMRGNRGEARAPVGRANMDMESPLPTMQYPSRRVGRSGP